MGASSPRHARLQSRAKLGCDFLIAAVALVIVAPLMVIVAMCVLIESPGPVFYRARRVGYRGAQIHILKFRKMHHGAGGRPLTLDADERFTRIGRWLARTKLDELPQLINVLKGNMSLVGPRPEDPDIVLRHRDKFAPILQVRPGITGLSQLAFAHEAKVLDPVDPMQHYEARILPQKLGLDSLYVATWHLSLDFQILWWTVAATVVRLPIAVNRSTGRMSLRLRRAPVAASLSPLTFGSANLGTSSAPLANRNEALLPDTIAATSPDRPDSLQDCLDPGTRAVGSTQIV